MEETRIAMVKKAQKLFEKVRNFFCSSSSSSSGKFVAKLGMLGRDGGGGGGEVR